MLKRKRCSLCKQRLPLSAFRARKDRNGSIESACTPCINKQSYLNFKKRTQEPTCFVGSIPPRQDKIRHSTGGKSLGRVHIAGDGSYHQ